ncbi:MAG: hypothetical protein B7Z31_00080 [Rhodobacterales bacterium 12-65-15]|nr:MAG: hypothetical protein B7Z31_00080 [Rhodobacterales bacterium 12-65-15]
MNITQSFTTGRFYAPEPQIIELVVLEDKSVLFRDQVRRITGRITVQYDEIFGDLPQFVLSCYDAGQYNGLSSYEFEGLAK